MKLVERTTAGGDIDAVAAGNKGGPYFGSDVEDRLPTTVSQSNRSTEIGAPRLLDSFGGNTGWLRFPLMADSELCCS